MERMYIWLAMTTTLYFSFAVNLAEGGCKGSWAIHACLGGNGKRSSSSSPDIENSIFFKRLQELISVRDTLEQLEKSQQPVVIPKTTIKLADLLTPAERLQHLIDLMALDQKRDYPSDQLSALEDFNPNDW